MTSAGRTTTTLHNNNNSNNSNHYDVLNVRRSSTSREIRDAFKHAALHSHPDKPYRDYPFSFIEVRAAAGVLLDARLRALYDAAELQQTVRWEGRVSDTVSFREFCTDTDDEGCEKENGEKDGARAAAFATLECRCGGEYTVLMTMAPPRPRPPQNETESDRRRTTAAAATTTAGSNELEGAAAFASECAAEGTTTSRPPVDSPLRTPEEHAEAGEGDASGEMCQGDPVRWMLAEEEVLAECDCCSLWIRVLRG